MESYNSNMENLDIYGILSIDSSVNHTSLISYQISDRSSSRNLSIKKECFSLETLPDCYDPVDIGYSDPSVNPSCHLDDDPGDLDHSCLLDVHRWSDHPEFSSLVQNIVLGSLPEGLTTKQIKHLKLIVLNLYVAWCEDPTLNIAFSRRNGSYSGPARYNRLWIKRGILGIIDLLAERGLIGTKMGFCDRREGGSGRNSRMWAKKPLRDMFQEAHFSALDIGWTEDRETILLRETRKDPQSKKRVVVDIDYEDTEETIRRRLFLTNDYNPILQRTFIGIPELEVGFVDLGKDKKGRTKKIIISQSHKFARCIYSQASLKKGGRFFGGFWQTLPGEWRRKLFIDGEPTVEIDFSGHHIVLLYARLGIDYWQDFGSDVYEIETPDFLDENETRECIKVLMLIALNAKDEKSTFAAFRASFEEGHPFRRLTDEELRSVLDRLREKHSPIGASFATGAGIDLMHTDSEITENILRHFTDRGIVCLSVHDSYIVQAEHAAELRRVMAKAFRDVTGVGKPKMKSQTGVEDQRRSSRYIREYQAFQNRTARDLAA